MAAPEVPKIDYDSDEEGKPADRTDFKTPCTGAYGQSGDTAKRVVREVVQNFIDEIFREPIRKKASVGRKKDYKDRIGAGTPILEETVGHGGKVQRFRFHDGKGFEFGTIVYSEVPMEGPGRTLQAPFFCAINRRVHADRSILLEFRSDKDGGSSPEAGQEARVSRWRRPT